MEDFQLNHTPEVGCHGKFKSDGSGTVSKNEDYQ
jgi:hypothetical protein